MRLGIIGRKAWLDLMQRKYKYKSWGYVVENIRIIKYYNCCDKFITEIEAFSIFKDLILNMYHYQVVYIKNDNPMFSQIFFYQSIVLELNYYPQVEELL